MYLSLYRKKNQQKRHVDPSGLTFSLSLHFHHTNTQISLLFSSRLSFHNKQLLSLIDKGRDKVYVRRVDPSTLGFSLSSHRHSYIRLLFNSRFIDS